MTATATMTLWAFLGIESATVAAENVDRPEENVAKATIFGVLIATVVYILGTMSVMAIVPVDELSVSTAPFADAANSLLGPAAEYFVAIGAVISCLGAVNGIIMMLGQMPFALARDRLFHPMFKKLSKQGTPTAALILSGILTTLFIGFNYARGLVDLFTFIILLSTLSMLLPLAFTTMSELIILLKRRGSIFDELT